VITAHAKDSFERIFRKAAQARLPSSPDDECAIMPLAQAGESAAQGTQVVVLTISSIVFRLLLILHFDENDSTRGYYLKKPTSGHSRRRSSKSATCVAGR